MADAADQRVLIAGAGIAGLTAALALDRRGIRSTVFERQPEPREHASAIQIFVNGMLALHELGLGDRLERISRPVHDYRFRSWRGKLLFEVPVGEIARGQNAPPPVVVRRPELLELLLDAVGDDVVRWGADCVGYEQEDDCVLLRLSDGSEQRGAFLLGADGTDSFVRRQLVPEATPRFAGYQYLRALTRFDRVPEYDFWVTFGRGDRFLFHDLGDLWVYWAGVLVAEPGTGDPPEGRKAQLLERFREFPAPIPALIEATDEGAIYRTDIRDLEPKHSWVDGRVALIGDAAHATTPNLGRGAGEAISDAVALARTLAAAGGLGGGVPQALVAYGAERRAATAAVQRRSWKIGRIASWSNPVACTLREELMRRVVSRAMRRGMEAELRARAAA